MFKLSDDDAKAVDMILDTHAAHHENGHGAVTVQPAHFRTRISKVTQILELLKAMPAAEPPEQLLASTMNRISTSSGKRFPTILAPQSAEQPQPHA